MNGTDTRTRLLTAIYELMLKQGYAGTGVGEICRYADVSKGSFYHFFETKQHSVLEMLKCQMAEAEALIEKGLDLSGLGEVEAAIQYVQHIEKLSEDFFAQGCLVGAFALELAETHPELRQEVSVVFNRTTDRFEQMLAPLAKACCSGEGPSPRELAEQMLTCIEGGVVLSKAHGDLRFVSQSIRLFRHYLQTLCQPLTSSSA